MKPNITTLAAAGSITFNNNKTSDWLDGKSKEEIEKYICLLEQEEQNSLRSTGQKKYCRTKLIIWTIKIRKGV